MSVSEVIARRLSPPPRLYSYAAFGIAALVFAGFAPSYYLRAAYVMPPLTETTWPVT